MCIRKSRVVFPRYPLLTTHQPLFFALCFHTLLPRSARGTNCFPRLPAGLLAGNPFVLTFIRIARGVWGLSSLTLCFSAAACPDLANASPFVSCSYGLFVTPKNVKSFAIKQIQTLFAKHPGWGVSRIPNASTGQTLRFLAVSSSVVSVPLWQIASHQVSDQDTAGGVVGGGGAQLGDGGGAVFAA